MPRWPGLVAVVSLASCDEGPTDPFAVPVSVTPTSSAEAPLELPLARYTAPPRFTTITVEATGAVPLFVTPAYPLANTVSNTSVLADDAVETLVVSSLGVFDEVAPFQRMPLQITLDDRTWRWRTGEFVVKLPLDIRYLWQGQAEGELPRDPDVVPEQVATAVDIFVKFSFDCDLDDDGVDAVQCGDRDCDDQDATTLPGVDETCDGVDEDCDGAIDEGAVNAKTWYRDADDDNHGDDADSVDACTRPEGYVASNDDCDDEQNRVHPGVNEACANGIDDDCDGKTDGADLDCS